MNCHRLIQLHLQVQSPEFVSLQKTISMCAVKGTYGLEYFSWEGGKQLIHTNTECYIIGNLQECDFVSG